MSKEKKERRPRPVLTNEEKQLLLGKPVLTIGEAGDILDMCRNAAYAAAKANLIPTVKVGEKALRVPTALFRKQLGLVAA